MRRLDNTDGATWEFKDALRPADPQVHGAEERLPDGLFFIMGIFLGLILAWIIL